MSRQPTLADVARVAGVSPTTVSRVINNRGYLSAETRDAVRDAMDELGYLPNAAARQLKLQRRDVIGVVVPTLRNPFYAEFVSRLDAAAARTGTRLIIAENEPGDPREAGYLDLLRAGQVDGLITGAHSDVVVTLADDRSLPVVTLDRTNPAEVINICCDNTAGAYEMTRLLIERARGPVLYLTSTADPANRRQQGYEQALEETGAVPRVLEVGFEAPREVQRQRIADFLSGVEGDRPGVFCSNDVYAAFVLGWAAEEGRRVPDDLLVAGFDGTELMTAVLPQLATVRQPLAEMAEAALQVVIALRDGETPPAFSPFPVTLLDAPSAGA